MDESYLPFVADGEKQSLVACGFDNLLVLLSISKIYRIPGLRVGFLVASPATIQAFTRAMWPWSVNSLAQAAVRFLCDAGPAIDDFVAQTASASKANGANSSSGWRTSQGSKSFPVAQ